MYTVFPWMFDLCNNDHKLTCLFAYIFDCCQGEQIYVKDLNTVQDAYDLCRIEPNEVDACFDRLVDIKALNKIGSCAYSINM